MTVRLATRKIKKIILIASNMLKAKLVSIRDFAKLIGKNGGSRAWGKICGITLQNIRIRERHGIKVKSWKF